ncbi:MAG: hypothetical protein JXB35_05890 [Anaerolineae bacterium]|nr:hypothetical protein [Anaerolineae bacterium]
MHRRLIWFPLTALILIAFVACNALGGAPTPDTQATIDAAVAATATAQAAIQSTIDAAVYATATAQAAVATPEVEVVQLTEEELAALIDEAVAEAAAATETCSDAATSATSDDAVTQEEVVAVEISLAGAEEAIAYAEELIDLYYGLYGELAYETLDLLYAIEEDLSVLAQNTADIAVALEEIAVALEQGVALADEALTQLETAAQNAAAMAYEVQAQHQDLMQTVQAELEARLTEALAVPPNAVAADRAGAVQSAFTYIDGVREALADQKLTSSELHTIAQLGANASASLDVAGGPQLQRLAQSVVDITSLAARGQIPQVGASLGQLESALGDRPSLPSRP